MPRILHRKSSVAGKRPTNSQIVAGEIAVNSRDGKLYTIANGSVKAVGGQWEENGSDIYYNDGNVGIGTDDPEAPLSVTKNTTVGTANNASAVFQASESSGVDAKLVLGVRNGHRPYIHAVDGDTKTADSLDFGVKGNETAVRIDADGNVGIGTTLPDTELDVRGTILGGASAPSLSQIAFGVQYGGSTNILNTFGTMKSSAATVIGWGVYGGATQDTFVSSVDTSLSFKRGALVVDQDELKFYNGAQQTLARDASATMTERMRLTNAGDLHVDGDVTAYSTTVSDVRLKEDIKTIENSLDKVTQLRGVSYTWNAGSREGQQDLGLIAQEVEEVFPEIVREKELALVDGKSYKTVDYEKLVGVLIEAVKELKAEIDELKAAR